MIAAVYLMLTVVAVTAAFTAIFFVVVAVNILSLIITKVPPISTGKRYFPLILEQLDITPETVIMDLGCGSGDFLLAAAGKNPKLCIGYELSLMPYFVAMVKSIFFGGGRIRLYFRDFFRADIGSADIVYIYLVPPLLSRIAKKLQAEMKPGSVAAVKGMPLPQSEYEKKIILDAARGYSLYLYRF